eukprot:3346395-Pyramimonas_sp.AAC.1
MRSRASQHVYSQTLDTRLVFDRTPFGVYIWLTCNVLFAHPLRQGEERTDGRKRQGGGRRMEHEGE